MKYEERSRAPREREGAYVWQEQEKDRGNKNLMQTQAIARDKPLKLIRFYGINCTEIMKDVKCKIDNSPSRVCVCDACRLERCAVPHMQTFRLAQFYVICCYFVFESCYSCYSHESKYNKITISIYR